jgi:hypothetical protein
MENKTINIKIVAKVAKALRELRSQVVFVGGAVISLYTDDEAAGEIRPGRSNNKNLIRTLFPGYQI